MPRKVFRTTHNKALVLSFQRIVFISGALVLIPILVASSLLEGCIKPQFRSCPHLQKIKTDMVLLVGPSLLALMAVVFVSVYAFKLQLEIKKKVQPRVNLPTLQQRPAFVTMEDQAERIDKGSELSESLDMKVLAVENLGDDQSRSRMEDQKEENIVIKRKNSDPNSFFRLPAVDREVSVPDMTSCFKPLMLIAERIMMLNIVALLWLLMIAISLILRIYLYTNVTCKESSLIFPVMLSLVLLLLVYILFVRKKLCK